MAGINVFDPRAYLVAMAFFALVVALSILAPGRRAIRINPSKALQHEWSTRPIRDAAVAYRQNTRE